MTVKTKAQLSAQYQGTDPQNQMDDLLDSVEDGSLVKSQAAQNVTVYSAGALAIGDLLHISGHNGTYPAVEKADADAGKPAQLIATAVNAGGTTSQARDVYELTGQNTNAATVGDPVYLNTVAGGWTLTPPTAANARSQIVGRVTVKSATVGKILFDLENLEDVAFATSNIQDLAVTGAKLAANVPGAGMLLSSSQLIPNIHGLPAAAAFDVVNDNLAISDESEAGDPTGYVPAATVVAGIIGAGLAQDAATKVILPNIHGLPAAAAFDVVNDNLAISDESEAGDPTGYLPAATLVAGIVGAGLTQNAGTKVIDIAAGGVTAAMMANGAGWAALLAAGLGGSGSWIKTDVGVKTIHTGTAGTKKVLIVATVTEAFADAGGTQTAFKIGQVGTDDKFAAAALFADAILNKVFVVTGELTASTDLIVTVTAAVGAGTGALSVMAMILPATV